MVGLGGGGGSFRKDSERMGIGRERHNDYRESLTLVSGLRRGGGGRRKDGY